MPLGSGEGAPRPKKPVGYIEPRRRRCLGIITPETLEILRRKAAISEEEYLYYKRMMEEMK